MKRILVTLIVCLFFVLAILLKQVCSTSHTVTEIEKIKTFNDLLTEWNLKLPDPYTITHYERINTRSEWGSILELFKLETSSGVAQTWLESTDLNDLHWSSRGALVPMTPKVDWWRAESGSKYYYGFLTSQDTRQYIRFTIVVKTNSEIFVESLSGIGKKQKSL